MTVVILCHINSCNFFLGKFVLYFYDSYDRNSLLIKTYASKKQIEIEKETYGALLNFLQFLLAIV